MGQTWPVPPTSVIRVKMPQIILENNMLAVWYVELEVINLTRHHFTKGRTDKKTKQQKTMFTLLHYVT